MFETFKNAMITFKDFMFRPYICIPLFSIFGIFVCFEIYQFLKIKRKQKF